MSMSTSKATKNQTWLYISSILLAAIMLIYVFNYLRPRKVDDQRLVSEKDPKLKDRIQVGTGSGPQSQTQPNILPPIIVAVPESKQNSSTKVFLGKTLIVFGNAYALKASLTALSSQLGHSFTDDKFHQKLYIKFKNENGQPLIELLKKEAAVDYSL